MRNRVIGYFGDRAPDEVISITFANNTICPVADGEHMRRIRCRSEVPRHFERIASSDLHLSCLRTLCHRNTIHAGFLEGYAIGFSCRDLAEGKGKRVTLETKFHCFGNHCRAISLKVDLDIEAL